MLTALFYLDRKKVDAKKVQNARPWALARHAAFSVDPKGANLPLQSSPWRFVDEIQPEKFLSSDIILDPDIRYEDAVYRGLDEKGWYVTYRIYGISSSNELTEKQKSLQLTPEAAEMAADLDDLFKK
jgi:hypothetical protein